MHNHCQTLIKPNNVLIQFVLRRISLTLHSLLIEYYFTCNKKNNLKNPDNLKFENHSTT